MSDSFRLAGQNIGYCVDTLKICTRAQLATSVGISVAAVGQLIRGETKEPKPSNLAKAAKRLGLSSDDLITRDLRKERWQPRLSVAEPGAKYQVDELLYLPMWSVAGSAGPGSKEDLVKIGELAFRRSWIKKKGWEPSQLHVHHVKGPSMEDWLYDGDVALVHYGDSVQREGGNSRENVFGFNDGDEGFRFKEIRPIEGGMVLRSFNKATDAKGKRLFPDEIRKGDELRSVQIIGRVVWRGG